MATLKDSVRVHKEGVAAFVSLPDDVFTYRIDFEEAEGRMWLKSSATGHEWECVILNREAFEADPAYCDQFNMELELLQLALHRDPNAKKIAACKHVLLTKSGASDLVMQLNQKVYSRLKPEMQPTIQFTLKQIAGGENCTRSQQPSQEGAHTSEATTKRRTRGAKSVMEPAATNPEEANTKSHESTTAKPATKRAKRTTKPVEAQPTAATPTKPAAKPKETLAQLREENKALKAGTRELFRVLSKSKIANEAMLREIERANAAKAQYADGLARAEAKYKIESKQWRSENEQLKTANAELLKLGGMHEFQRQHIEHLRRKIQALEEQLFESSSAGSQSKSRQGAATSNSLRNLLSEPQQTLQPAADGVSGAPEQSKCRRKSKS